MFDVPKTKNKRSISFKPFLGLFYTGLASMFATISSVFVKQLTYIDPGQLSLVRNIIIWAGCLPIATYCVKDVFGSKNDRMMLVVRGFLTATGLYLYIMAFRYLPLAEAAIVMSTSPAVTTIMARIFLKEACGFVQSFALVITLCGVLLSVRLPELLKEKGSTEFDSAYIGGLASAVGSVLVISVSLVALRKMKDVHFSVVLLYCGFIGMIENAVINASVSHFAYPRCGWDQISVILIGIFGFISHCTFVRAIQIESLAVVSAVRVSMDIVIAVGFQIVFFNVNPDIYDISGACLVIVAILIMGFRKWLINLPEESNTRKMFKYLLI